jgi:DNA invertase Pin-like site-specific DNA recombinase
MLEGYAEYYSAELSQKIRRGMNESRQKGNYTGGFILYGYKVENKKIIIDEEKAEVIRYMFEQYAKGVFVNQLTLVACCNIWKAVVPPNILWI